jgi:hypothetical protein
MPQHRRAGWSLRRPSRQFLDHEVAVRVDADVGGDRERALDDRARIERRVLGERARRGLRESAARADRDEVVLGLDHIAVARDHEELLAIADEQQRLEAAQIPVGPPVLRDLDRGAGEVAVLFELALEALEEREGIGGAAREAGEHLATAEGPHLAGIALHYGVAERDLAVATDGDSAIPAHPEDRGAMGVPDLMHRKAYFLRARGCAAS